MNVKHVINLNDFRITPWFNDEDTKLPTHLMVIPEDIYIKYAKGEIKDPSDVIKAIQLAMTGKTSARQKGEAGK